MDSMQLRLRTSDENLLKNSDYLKIMKIIDHLFANNIIQRGNGYCVSMSDMVRMLLEAEGVECDLVECKLTIMSKNPPGLILIGHSGQVSNFHHELDTHVVVVTKTEVPILIDLSIYGYIPVVPYICERLNVNKPNDMLRINMGHSEWVYQQKEISKIPKMYQKSLIDRFKTDMSVSKSLLYMKIWITIITAIVFLNGLRGAYDFYRMYMKKDAFPAKHQVIVDEDGKYHVEHIKN